MRAPGIAFVMFLAVTLASSGAFGQLYGESLGSIYVVNDPSLDPYESLAAAEGICNHYETDPYRPMEPFEFFLAVRIDFAHIGLPGENDTNGMQAWEAQVHIPDEIVITGVTLYPPGSINVGQPTADPNDSNFIVGTLEVIAATSTPFVLVQYEAFLAAELTDLVISISPAIPSSFTLGPGSLPGWVEGSPTGECGERECLRPFAAWWFCRSELVVNYTGDGPCGCKCGLLECGYATERSSWGALKARF